MSLVTVTDLREYMSGISLSASQLRTAELVISGTQQALEIYLNRPLELVQVREKRRTTPTGDLILSVTPVYTVISLRRLGHAEVLTLPDKDTTPLSDEDVDRIWDAMSEDNPTVPGGIYTGIGPGWYVIEYIGGYNGYVDDALKLAILEVASRTMTNNHDDTLTIKDDIAREPTSPPRPKGWQPEELKMFDRLRRRTVYQ